MKTLRFTIAMVLAFILTACATSPTGRRQLMIVSEEHAIRSSAQAYVQTIAPLQRQGKIDNNPALNARVKRITSLLVAQAVIMRPETKDWQWSMKVIDNPETVNAWCMAGGKMAIYTGLIEQIEPTDDELAQVIGHEIAHALANHTAEKMSVALASTAGIAAVGLATDSKAALTGAAAAALLAVQLPNSRTAETEADRIGIELAAKAGFDPRAAVTLWEKMEKVSGGSPVDFLSTHPSSGKRQDRLGQLVPEMIPYYEDQSQRPVYPL